MQGAAEWPLGGYAVATLVAGSHPACRLKQTWQWGQMEGWKEETAN